MRRLDYLLLAKAVLIVTFVVALLILELRFPIGDIVSIKNVAAFALMFPGILLFAPIIIMHIHDYWPGFLVMAMVVNWGLYVWRLYVVLDSRRRRVDRAN